MSFSASDASAVCISDTAAQLRRFFVSPHGFGCSEAVPGKFSGVVSDIAVAAMSTEWNYGPGWDDALIGLMASSLTVSDLPTTEICGMRREREYEMPHPLMFSEDDPFLAKVRAIALTLPEADEKISHGRPAFFTQKVFCYFGGSEHRDQGWTAHDTAIVFRPDPDDAPALRQDDRFWVPMYLGVSGWLGIDVDDTTDWQEITELIDASLRITAPRRLVRELDAR